MEEGQTKMMKVRVTDLSGTDIQPFADERSVKHPIQTKKEFLMKKRFLSLAAITLLAGSFGVVSAAEEGFSLVDDVKVKGELRPRYEFVDADNDLSQANAITNRAMIGIQADLGGTDWASGYLEMTDVHNLNDNYNSTDNGQAGHQIVVDPEQTRVTQGYIDLTFNKTLLRAGRQMVNIDNQRFVGAVGWRQMPQTFDAYAIVDNTIDGLNLMAAYVAGVNTIKAGALDSFDTESVILHASYAVIDAMTVTGYGYLLGSIHDTYGLALTGTLPVSDIKVNYRAEYAMQTDASMETGDAGKPDADASYMNFDVNMNMNGILAGLNYEVLSGTDNDKDTAFSTPLATLHAFNGWADKFLATPTEGLVDMNVMVGYANADIGLLKAIYHDFSSDVGSTDYGTEIDLLYKRPIPGVKGVVGMLKYADYSADDYSFDTQKFWVMLDYNFGN